MTWHDTMALPGAIVSKKERLVGAGDLGIYVIPADVPSDNPCLPPYLSLSKIGDSQSNYNLLKSKSLSLSRVSGLKVSYFVQ